MAHRPSSLTTLNLLRSSLTSRFTSTRRPQPAPFAQIQSQIKRTMADSAQPAITTPPAGKYEFLVVIPDKPGMTQKRLEVRPKHFEDLTRNKESGFFKMGGAIMNDVPEGADPKTWDFAGSTLVAVAASKEEVLEVLKKDIYTESGVWDLEKVQIWPTKLAFRYP